MLLLLAVAAASVAWAVHRNRLRNALAVERVRMRVATDLHDDIGADLSEIAILSELAASRDALERTRLLGEIGSSARRLVDTLSDIVWSTNPGKDDLGSVVQRIRHFAANALESRGIAWTLEVPDGLGALALDPERRRQVFLILKEAVTNVARHAGCTRASLRVLLVPTRSRSTSRTTGRASTSRPRHRATATGSRACARVPPPSARASAWTRSRRAARASLSSSPSARPFAPHRDAVVAELPVAEDPPDGTMNGRDRIRVALVEDKRLTREGLGALLDSSAELTCVGLYESVEQAAAGLGAAPCDVLLLDIHLPGMSGVDGVRVLTEKFPEMRVLMLTVYEDEERVFESICNGASGYLLKKTPPAQLVEAVRQARLGGTPLSPEIAGHIVRRFRLAPGAARPEPLLTAQEIRLLRLLADGHSYQSASDRLGVTINTVRDHVRAIYEKLHVHSRSEAVSKGLRRRLIE